MTEMSGAHRQRRVVPPNTTAMDRERAFLLARVEQDARAIQKERRQQMMKGAK